MRMEHPEGFDADVREWNSFEHTERVEKEKQEELGGKYPGASGKSGCARRVDLGDDILAARHHIVRRRGTMLLSEFLAFALFHF